MGYRAGEVRRGTDHGLADPNVRAAWRDLLLAGLPMALPASLVNAIGCRPIRWEQGQPPRAT